MILEGIRLIAEGVSLIEGGLEEHYILTILVLIILWILVNTYFPIWDLERG